MKFGIIKERKIPLDRRVVFTPENIISMNSIYSNIEIKVESSDTRIFNDYQYSNLGIEIVNDMTDCDILIGVKEVPVEYLIPNKKYFFFSHTIKKQPQNRKLLQSILEKNIELYDHETIVDENNKRLIGFGRYAGIVGTYNGMRAFGIKFDLFHLPKAENLANKEILFEKLKKQNLPPIKIVLTGQGKVSAGAKETLIAMQIKQVSIENFLSKIYGEPVFTQIGVLDYNKRIDGKNTVEEDFFNNPTCYVSDFEKFTKYSDIFIAGHYYANNAPNILTTKMLISKDCKLKVVADISCDIAGPIACTLRASTISDPIYGYLPSEHKEVNYNHPAAIVVMAIDNLPCELPKDSSEGFGESFMKMVIPAFFNNDKDQILARAKVTENGRLTKRFAYLQDFVDGIK